MLMMIYIFADVHTVHAMPLNGEGHDDQTYGIPTAVAGLTAICTMGKSMRPRRAKQKFMRDHLGRETRSTVGSVLFANITTWGPQAQRWFIKELANSTEPPWEAIGLAEHHLNLQGRSKLTKTFSKLLYKTIMTHAIPTGDSMKGTSGGVSISIPLNRAATMRDSTSNIQDSGPALHGRDWAIVILHRRGIDLAYCTAYFECGGPTATNRAIATEIGCTLRSLGLPYIIAADFNATPKEATESGIIGLLGGSIRTVPGTEFTCTSGQGRMLDYWVLSDDAKWVAHNFRLVYGSWKPHYGIAFDVIPLATIILGTCLRSPPKLLGIEHAKCNVDKLTPCNNAQWEKSYTAAQRGETKFKADFTKQGRNGLIVFESEARLGSKFAGWSARAANCTALQ